MLSTLTIFVKLKWRMNRNCVSTSWSVGLLFTGWFIGCVTLAFSTVWTNSADDILISFSFFKKKRDFDISCKLSPNETICMKFQSLFSGGKKIKMPSADIFTQNAKC